jgi:cytochrome P450
VSDTTTAHRVDALIARDQASIACPYPLFADLRNEGGATYNEALGAWLITRYDDVRAILRDTERFSSLLPTGPEKAGEALARRIGELMQDPEMQALMGAGAMSRGRAAVLLNADPPDHRRQRRLVNPSFKPDRLRAFEAPVIETTRRLLDAMITDMREHGCVDLVSRFAVGLPMTIIALVLGIPDDDLATFKRWSDDLVMPVGNADPSLEQVRGFVLSTKAFNDYFLAEIAQRRRQPTNDILSDIANAVIDGEELTDDEQLGMLRQFLVAGNETTTKLITNIVRALAEDPDLQQRIRDDRSLIEPLVEEMLRIEAPVGGLFRRAKVDVEINGTHIPAGDHLWLLFASANRDECKFAEPDTIDVDRANVREHLAFGNGEHFCPGAGLARTEARIAINLMLDALTNIRLADGNDFRFEDSFVLRGLKSLLITAD